MTTSNKVGFILLVMFVLAALTTVDVEPAKNPAPAPTHSAVTR